MSRELKKLTKHKSTDILKQDVGLFYKYTEQTNRSVV